MTPDQHTQRIRQIELQLELADYGMGMPRDYQRVLYLRQLLEQAKKDAAEAERSLAGLPVDIIGHFARRANDNNAITGYDILSDGFER